MINYRRMAIKGALGLSILLQPVFAQDLVRDDLITSSNKTTPWLQCDTDSPAVVSTLDAGGCAYRTTPGQPGVTYRMSCGVTVAKYASITLAFLDANDNTLSKKVTEVTEHVSGAYSVTLEAPAGTTNAAIGIYGETGSGFQDCVLIDATPPPEPTKGSIAGITWFDENGDSLYGTGESPVTGSVVTLTQGDAVLGQAPTGSEGEYYFGNLDVDACYTVKFSAADSTLELGATGGDNDALPTGLTNEICLTEAIPDVPHIDAAYVAIPPVVPPADYAVCGLAWIDANSNGTFDGTDTTLPHVVATLFDAQGNQISTTTTDDNGNYAFFKLPTGNYYVSFVTPDGHEPTTASSQPLAGSSYIGSAGNSGSFGLPADTNTGADSACTIQNVNAGYVQLPVALAPTVANDDSVQFDVGVDFSIDVVANDMPCDGAVDTVDLLGHNVPGLVTFDAQSGQFLVTNTTAFGVYSIQYGLRGACGSYDTATVHVELLEVIPPAPPEAPDAPICRVETAGSQTIGGVDVFNGAEDGFATNYNFYDRDHNLVITVDSSSYTHKIYLGPGQNQWEGPYEGNWEIEWNGPVFGYDQVSIHYVGAVENGVESELTRCDRSFVSPIAIDIENKGRIQRLVGDYAVDLDSDGIKEQLGQWFAPSAGILVTKDAKGAVTGDQLFGNIPGIYADGYEELATLDSNGDEQLAGKELKTLAIWHDLNSNTLVDAGELSTLSDHQIVSLSLNHHKYMARVTKANGKSVLMEDVWLPLAPMASR